MTDRKTSDSDGFGSTGRGGITRRDFLKAGATVAAAQTLGLGSPSAWAAGDAVRIGVLNPSTGTYAELGRNQTRGAEMAAAEINARGGVLGRKLDLIVTDTASKTGLAVSKAHQLVKQHGAHFLQGTVSSAVSEAIEQASREMGVLFVDSGGHATPVTGKQCTWSTFRVCTTTYMLAAGIAETLMQKYGKRWYFLTPNYAFGLTEQAAFERILKAHGGTVLGAALAPLGTTDFSAYLIQAQAAKPDCLIILQAGDDLVHALTQVNQFGLQKKFGVAGGMMELEVLQALPAAARVGDWSFEWWWDQPNVPEVKSFVERYRKRNGGKYPTARSWFGYVATHAIAQAADEAKSLDSVKVSRALAGLTLPVDVGLQPAKLQFRASDHQLMSGIFAGGVKAGGHYPDLFQVEKYEPGASIAQSATEKGCHMTYPS
ncbi:ABC transporter substrate-binding protein [Acidihalobacter aeolianus]|uniref:ABC transporter substrate-binding protein n=1 Tax=Acidihalobacter aeolianus TaxID=2792603 RepID=A0A1D8K4E3_9GAMM|nr:ABC transporter substrate-binding protein [Acidihalobacter aeolianus]AOV15833.1 ABC transporter substrate-binding protein [Acidihalobacter aeolianus]